jgi:hypothetical protein
MFEFVCRSRLSMYYLVFVGDGCFSLCNAVRYELLSSCMGSTYLFHAAVIDVSVFVDRRLLFIMSTCFNSFPLVVFACVVLPRVVSTYTSTFVDSKLAWPNGLHMAQVLVSQAPSPMEPVSQKRELANFFTLPFPNFVSACMFWLGRDIVVCFLRFRGVSV